MADIQDLLDTARKELLDLSMRNTLLNYRPLKAKGVEVVDELPEQVFRILVAESRAMSFLPAPDKEDEDDNELTDSSDSEEIVLEQPEEEEEVNEDGIAVRHVDVRLQTAYTSAVLQKRLLNSFYTARTYIEEQGISVLYLALGMLSWFESERSEVERRAPLVLVPVELYRTDVRTRFRIRYTQDDIGDNVSLGAKLKTDFGLTLPEVSQDEDLDLMKYFDQVEKAVSSRSRWDVDRSAIALAFFSFGRFLMYNDLDVNNWPETKRLTDHPVLRAMLQDGFDEPPLEISPDALIDAHVSPEDSFQVVDADSSQTLAILDVLKGRNLVVQGPPGTGKSQTITNLIAEALGRGKTVLFVAEKMAALEVVKRRLDEVGLGEACLELHSHKANKKAFLEELRRTLELGKPKLDDFSADLQVLIQDRDRLNRYSEAVNTPIGESGITPFYAFGMLTQLRRRLNGIEMPSLSPDNMGAWSSTEARLNLEQVQRLEALLDRIGVPIRHPFWGSQAKAFLPADRREVQEICITAGQSVRDLQIATERAARHLSLPVPRTRQDSERVVVVAEMLLEAPPLEGIKILSREWLTNVKEVEEGLGVGEILSTSHQQADKYLIPEAWDHDVRPIYQAYIEFGTKWWRFLSGAYRQANKEMNALVKGNLPKKLKHRLILVKKIMQVQKLRPIYEEHEGLMQQLFGSQWHGLDSDWDVLQQIASWIAAFFEQVKQGKLPRKLAVNLDQALNRDVLHQLSRAVTEALSQHATTVGELVQRLQLNETVRFGAGGLFVAQPFAAQLQLIRDWHNKIDALQEIVMFNHLTRELSEAGFGAVNRVAATWPGAKDHLVHLVKKSWYEELVSQAFRERPELSVFDSQTHEVTIEKFCEVDLFSFQVKRAKLAYDHWRQLPSHEAGGQLGILRREFAKRRRHLPIRKLIDQAGNAVQAIKPVLMMSPLSIAMYLPPASVEFDFVIFDEASQVRPVEAFGAIVRGKQTAVVGDSRQLPPTNFFQQIVEAEEEEESPTADLESVLGLFSAQGAPGRMLRWHYRSRHESLIAVSNHEFYENKLVVFPSPDAKREDVGVVYHYLPDTVYDRGRSRTNRQEAQAVANAVLEHARNRPHLTLGVAAFSISQMQAIQDQLEFIRRKNPSTERFFSDHQHEPFFVKNLENVQGDERDVIFISVGYGRTADGYVSMNFGPLNRDGGERRLNVLITRARYRCEVFTNLTADDIDLNRSRARGVIALKRYLKYAKDDQLEIALPTGREAGSPFEEAVANALSAKGYDVVAQVGSAGFFIDLAIVDDRRPGRYLLGIECDGATYHSARSARDRDRLRQQVLENVGWCIHRIWSTDWFRNPERELTKTVHAIEEARSETLADEPSSVLTFQEAATDKTATIERIDVPPPSTKTDASDYELAELHIQDYSYDLHEVPLSRLSDWIQRVVDVEGPVHTDDVARRIADSYGVKRIGRRISESIQAAIDYCVRMKRIDRKGKFLWSTEMTEPRSVRSHANLPSFTRKIDQIAPEEIMLAIETVVANALGMKRDEIPLATCSLLGYGRTSKVMQIKVDRLVEKMTAERRLILKGEYLVVFNVDG